jgi:replicative DNA helicase
MSKRLGKPVICLAQANRESVKNKKKGQSPELHDLAESDGIAQNSTRVIALSVLDGILKLSIKKNRYGINNKDVLVMWDINSGYIKPILENSEGGKDEEDYGF